MQEKKRPADGNFNLTTFAEYAGISLPTALEWVRRDNFPAFRSGRRWIIPRGPAIKWMEERAAERAEL